MGQTWTRPWPVSSPWRICGSAEGSVLHQRRRSSLGQWEFWASVSRRWRTRGRLLFSWREQPRITWQPNLHAWPTSACEPFLSEDLRCHLMSCFTIWGFLLFYLHTLMNLRLVPPNNQYSIPFVKIVNVLCPLAKYYIMRLLVSPWNMQYHGHVQISCDQWLVFWLL